METNIVPYGKAVFDTKSMVYRCYEYPDHLWECRFRTADGICIGYLSTIGNHRWLALFTTCHIVSPGLAKAIKRIFEEP